MSKLSVHIGRYCFLFIVMICYIGAISSCKDYSINKNASDSVQKEACIIHFIANQMSEACTPSGTQKTYGFACKQIKGERSNEPYTCEETEKYVNMINLCTRSDPTGTHVSTCIKELRDQFILPVLYKTTVDCKDVTWQSMVSAHEDDANSYCSTNATP